MTKSQYVYGLDVIRLAAAVYVSLFHFTWCTPGAIPIPFGWIAVQIFFVISGYVIAQSVSGATAGQFLKSRILRIFPAAWVALGVNTLCLAITPPAAYAAHRLAVWLSLRKVVYSFVLFGPTYIASAYWTLPIEITFYAVVFTILLVRGEPSLRAVAIGLTILSLPYQILLGLHEAHVLSIPWIDLRYGQLNCLLVRHGCFFAIGIFLYLDSRAPLKGKSAIVPMIALLLGCIEIFARGVELVAVTKSPPYTPAAIGLFLLVLLAIKASVRYAPSLVPPPGAQRVIKTASLATYPYYLIHECAGGAALYRFTALGLPFEAALVLTVLAVAAVAIAITLWGEPVLRRALRAVLFPRQTTGATILVP